MLLIYGFFGLLFMRILVESILIRIGLRRLYDRKVRLAPVMLVMVLSTGAYFAVLFMASSAGLPKSDLLYVAIGYALQILALWLIVRDGAGQRLPIQMILIPQGLALISTIATAALLSILHAPPSV